MYSRNPEIGAVRPRVVLVARLILVEPWVHTKAGIRANYLPKFKNVNMSIRNKMYDVHFFLRSTYFVLSQRRAFSLWHAELYCMVMRQKQQAYHKGKRLWAFRKWNSLKYMK